MALLRAQALRILEVGDNATDEEIKKAYRRAAAKWHPDRNKEPQAEARFKEAKQAYEYLLDPTSKFNPSGGNAGEGLDIQEWFRRAQEAARSYSAYGTGKRGDRPKVEPIDDYQNSWGSSGPGAASHGAAQRVQILNIQIAVTLEEAFRGVTKSLDIPDPSKISGSQLQVEIPPGLSPGERFKTIETPTLQIFCSIRIVTPYTVQFNGPFQVNGAGNIGIEVKVDPFLMMTGGYIEHKCIDDSVVQVRVPAGIEANMSLKLQGKGYWASTKHRTRGDCFLKLIPNIKKLEEYSEDRLKEVVSHINEVLTNPLGKAK